MDICMGMGGFGRWPFSATQHIPIKASPYRRAQDILSNDFKAGLRMSASGISVNMTAVLGTRLDNVYPLRKYHTTDDQPTKSPPSAPPIPACLLSGPLGKKRRLARACSGKTILLIVVLELLASEEL